MAEDTTVKDLGLSEEFCELFDSMTSDSRASRWQQAASITNLSRAG